MELNIEFEALDPPQGWTRPTTSGERLRFEGWLGLIRSIEALVGEAAASTHPTIESSHVTDGNGSSARGKEQ
jgi:hypothetical protein